MVRAEEDGRPGLAPAAIVLGLTLLAAVLRFYRLGDWGLEGDEIFTLRDSLHPQLDNPRPLIYFLNHWLVAPFHPLDELGLRVLPAIFGVLAIPAFFFVCRRLVGTRASLFGTALLTFSALHVYQSQYARYWSLVFFFSAIYPYALYVWVRDRSRPALALGLITAVLGILSHPVAGLPIGGLVLWLMVTSQRGRVGIRLWNQPRWRWSALAALVLVGVVLARYTRVLRSWLRAHDGPDSGDHLLHLPGTPVVKQISYLMSYAEGLTLALVLCGLLGLALLWRGRDRALAILLVCVAGVPIVFLVLLSFRTAVSTTYLLPTTPVFFIAGGVLLDHLVQLEGTLRPRWLLGATVMLMILLSGAPTLVSQYRDGRRHDFRGAGVWLGQQTTPTDVVFSDQAGVLTHYLPSPQPVSLTADVGVLTDSLKAATADGRDGSVWIVAPASARGGFRTNARIGSLTDWIYNNCQLRNTLGVARLDFRQNQLQIYRCPPAAPATRE